MNTYTVETPRTAIALCAIALSALTIGTLVAVPAVFDSGYAPETTLAMRAPPSVVPVEVAISPARIDVIAIRAPNVAWALEDNTKPNCKPEV
jgi:hypothetical protein